MEQKIANEKSVKTRISNCNICNAEIEEDNGDIVGYFGITPVAFCVWCLSSMTDMIVEINGYNDVESLKEKIKDLEAEQK